MARSEETNRRLRERSRETLLEAAMELFASQGFNGTTMHRVADRAGVSKGLAYNYFRSKEDILGTLLEARMKNLTTIVRAVPGDRAPRDQLEWLVDALFDDVVERPELYRLYLSLTLHPQSVSQAEGTLKEMESILDDYFARLRAIFEALPGADPDVDMLFFRGAMMGLCLRVALDPRGFPREEIKRRLLAGIAEGASHEEPELHEPAEGVGTG